MQQDAACCASLTTGKRYSSVCLSGFCLWESVLALNLDSLHVFIFYSGCLVHVWQQYPIVLVLYHSPLVFPDPVSDYSIWGTQHSHGSFSTTRPFPSLPYSKVMFSVWGHTSVKTRNSLSMEACDLSSSFVSLCFFSLLPFSSVLGQVKAGSSGLYNTRLLWRVYIEVFQRHSLSGSARYAV